MALALRMIWFSPWVAIVSVTIRPFSASLTVAVTTISCSGKAHSAELDRKPLQRARVARGHRGVGPRDLGHRPEPVEDAAGQADLLCELLVDVDRVHVARCLGVAFRQALRRA